MKQIGVYNKLPEKLKVTPLKKGQTVLYRLVNSVIDPADPKQKRLIWPKAIKIPTLDTILDPDTGSPVEIGVVSRVDKDGLPTIKTYWVRGMENNGYFNLSSGNRDDDYYYWYFERSNYNKSNPFRDESIDPLFERVDRLKDAKMSLSKLDQRLEALVYARDMKPQDLKTLAAAMSWDENDEIEILRDKAKDYAEQDPLKFSKMVRSKDIEFRALTKRAQDAGVLKFNIPQNKVQWANGDTIATLPRVEGQDWMTGFADWLITAKNGEKTLEAIRKLMAKEAA